MDKSSLFLSTDAAHSHRSGDVPQQKEGLSEPFAAAFPGQLTQGKHMCLPPS
jgi:hypothetical protein